MYNPLTKTHVLSAAQQTTLNGSTLGAAAVAAAFAGIIGTRLGRRGGLFISLIPGLLTGIVQITATTWGGLLAGRILGGIGAGLMANFLIPYWAEITPASLRGMIIVSFQDIVNVAQFVGQCINEGTYDLDSLWSFRAPLMTEFVPVVLLFIGLFFIPETPRRFNRPSSLFCRTELNSYRLVRRPRSDR